MPLALERDFPIPQGGRSAGAVNACQIELRFYV